MNAIERGEESRSERRSGGKALIVKAKGALTFYGAHSKIGGVGKKMRNGVKQAY